MAAVESGVTFSKARFAQSWGGSGTVSVRLWRVVPRGIAIKPRDVVSSVFLRRVFAVVPL